MEVSKRHACGGPNVRSNRAAQCSVRGGGARWGVRVVVWWSNGLKKVVVRVRVREVCKGLVHATLPRNWSKNERKAVWGGGAGWGKRLLCGQCHVVDPVWSGGKGSLLPPGESPATTLVSRFLRVCPPGLHVSCTSYPEETTCPSKVICLSGVCYQLRKARVCVAMPERLVSTQWKLSKYKGLHHVKGVDHSLIQL